MTTTRHNIRIKRFNLIEIMLALFVIAMGVSGIMGLLPVGFKAAQDSRATNYSSLVAEELIDFLSLKAQTDWDTWIGNSAITGYVRSNEALYDSAYETTDLSKSGYNELGSTGFFDDVYQYGTTSSAFRVYKESSGSTDFTASMKVWKRQAQVNVYNPKIDDVTLKTFGWDEAVNLVVEISWPINRAIDKREKRVFSKIVRNPNAMTY